MYICGWRDGVLYTINLAKVMVKYLHTIGTYLAKGYKSIVVGNAGEWNEAVLKYMGHIESDSQ